jgi:hypothetical protein
MRVRLVRSARRVTSAIDAGSALSLVDMDPSRSEDDIVGSEVCEAPRAGSLPSVELPSDDEVREAKRKTNVAILQQMASLRRYLAEVRVQRQRRLFRIVGNSDEQPSRDTNDP